MHKIEVHLKVDRIVPPPPLFTSEHTTTVLWSRQCRYLSLAACDGDFSFLLSQKPSITARRECYSLFFHVKLSDFTMFPSDMRVWLSAHAERYILESSLYIRGEENSVVLTWSSVLMNRLMDISRQFRSLKLKRVWFFHYNRTSC